MLGPSELFHNINVFRLQTLYRDGGQLAILFLKPFISSTKSFAPPDVIPMFFISLQRAKWSGCRHGWGNVDRAIEVEISKYLGMKSSLLFWRNLGSLNTSYQGRTSITSIPSLIWISILVFYLLIICLVYSFQRKISTWSSSLFEPVDNKYFLL